MKKRAKKFLLIGSAVLLSIFVILVISSLILYYKKSLTKNLIQKFVADKTGGKLEIGKLNYSLFPLRVQVNSLRVAQRIEEMEVDIFFDRLSLNGNVRRVLKKEKPFFQAVDAQGGTCRIWVPKAGKKVDLQQQILLLSNALSYMDKISLQDLSLDFIYLTSHVSLQRGRLALSGLSKGGEFDFYLSGEEVEVTNVQKKMSVQCSFRSEGTISLIESPFLEGELLLSPLSLNFAGREFHAEQVENKVRAELLSGSVLSFPKFELSIPPVLHISTSLKVDMQKEYSFSLSPRIHLKEFEGALALLKPYLQPSLSSRLKDFNVKGSATIDAELEDIKISSGREMKFRGLFRLNPTELSYSTPDFSLQNLISGELRLKGPIPRLEFSGEFKVEKGNFSKQGIKIQDFSLDLPLQGTSSSIIIPRLRGRFEGLSYNSLDNKKINLEEFSFEGRAGYNLTTEKIDVDPFELRVLSSPPFRLEAKAAIGLQGKKSFWLRTSPIDIASLTGLFSSFLPDEAVNWEPRAVFSVEAEGKNSPQDDGTWKFSVGFDLSQGSFHNPPFTIAAEALHPKIFLEGEYGPALRSVPFTLSFDLSQGESLWNKYYINWGKNPFQGKASGVFHIPDKRLDNFSLEVLFSSLGKIGVEGGLKFQTPYPFDLRIRASRLDFRSLHSLMSQEATGENSGLHWQGEAEAEVNVKKEAEMINLGGQILVRNGSIGKKDKGFFLEGIEAKVPFYYQSQSEKENGQEEPFLDKGFFSIKQFTSPFLSVAPFRLDFNAGKNKFQVEPLTLELFGGKASVGSSLFSISSNPFTVRGHSSLSIKEVDISKIPIESEQFSFSGRVDADLDSIEINPEAMTAQGQAAANIFDGRVAVKNIKVTKPFSPGRTISCHVDLENLSLEKFTDSVPFGRVTGVLSGKIEDLAFSYGQPERFSLSLESVKKKGIPQKFSLGAVNDLSIISSGEGAAVSPKKGFTRFITEFGYEKIGIFCSLKNDIFTLRGMVSEKGVEYLVKRSWIFGISVVNKNPRNRIRWNDMVDRLKRVGQSGGPKRTT